MKRARTKKGGLGCTIALVILVVIAVVAVFHFIGEKIVQIGEYLAIQNFSLYLAFTVFIVVAIIFHYFFIFRPLKRATSPEKSVIDYNDLVEHDKLELEPSFPEDLADVDQEAIELDTNEMDSPYESVTFATNIVGVTHKNKDGINRQKLIKELRPEERLILKREPDNPYDEYAIAVYNLSGQQLGYIPSGDYMLAEHMDIGDNVSVSVLNVTGGSYGKSYGCNIKINKYFYSRYLRNLEKNIDNKINLSKEIEKEKPLTAIKLYRKIIDEIKELDSLKSGYRTARYPINRLSLVLERLKDYENAYDEIIKYEQYENYTGLTKTDKEAVIKRKIRLEKKLK